jgi:hypothetical protein
MCCLRCRGLLLPTGQEPHRFVCEHCGQNYLVVLQLVPVDPLRPLALTDPNDAGQRSRTT